MKKTIKSLFAVLAVLAVTTLAACSLFLQKTTLVNTQIAGDKTTITYYTKRNSDKVVKQEALSEVTLSKLMGSKSKKQTNAAYAKMKAAVKPYKGLAGVTTEVKRDGDKATQKITIDYTKVNMKKLKAAEGAGTGTADSVSLKQSVGVLKAAGYEEK